MIDNLFKTLELFQAELYEQTWLTIEMVLASAFVSIIAGFMLGILFAQLKKMKGLAGIVSAPFRGILLLAGSYPIIIFAIIAYPIIKALFGTVYGSSAGQFVMTVWGSLYFGSLIYRYYSVLKIEDDREVWIMIDNIRRLFILLISGNVVLSMIGMGGLGDLLMRYGLQHNHWELVVIISLIYLAFVIVIEGVFALIVSASRQKASSKESIMATMTTGHVLSEGQEKAERQSSKAQSTPIKSTQKRENAPNDLDYLIRKN